MIYNLQCGNLLNNIKNVEIFNAAMEVPQVVLDDIDYSVVGNFGGLELKKIMIILA